MVIDPFGHGGFWGDGVDGLLAGGWVTFLVQQGLFVLVVALVVLTLVLVPRQRLATVEKSLVSRPGSAFGFGLITFVLGYGALVVLFGLLVLTVIGIPLALLLALAVFLLSMIAIGTVAIPVGRRLCTYAGLDCKQSWLLAVLGMGAFHALNFLGSLIGVFPAAQPLAMVLGILGLALKSVVYIFGLGAIVQSRLGRTGTAAVGTSGEGAPIAEAS